MRDPGRSKKDSLRTITLDDGVVISITNDLCWLLDFFTDQPGTEREREQTIRLLDHLYGKLDALSDVHVETPKSPWTPQQHRAMMDAYVSRMKLP